MNDTESLPAQIKATRRRLGLTQAQAAVVWGIPAKTLQKYEQGERTPRGLALDAIRQKLAADVVGVVPFQTEQSQFEQPEGVPAPEATGGDVALDVPSEADKYLAFPAAQAAPEPQAQGDDATLDTPTQGDPAPPADTSSAAPVEPPSPIPSTVATTPPDEIPDAAAIPQLVATPDAAAPRQVGVEWEPFVSVAHSYARYRERMRSSPPVTGDVGW